MSAQSSPPRVVIVGAGIVGTSLADELTARGHHRVTVLDQGRLPTTGGSSSHAPGLVFQTNPSRTMAHFATYTVQKFRGLNSRDHLCFNTVGGLEVATTPARLLDLHRKLGWAKAWGIPAEMVDPSTCAQRYPLLDADAVLGGLYTPTDGLAGAGAAIDAQTVRATERGAVFRGEQTVVEVLQSAGRVTGVRTTTDTFDADIVVSCAGFWGSELGDLVGLRVPLVPMAHQYVHTADVTALADLPTSGAPADAGLPIVRHQDDDLYYRQHGSHIGIGYYGHRPMPVDMTALGDDTRDQPMPSMLPFTGDDFASAWRESQRLLPPLRDTTLAGGFNGVFSFTPDGGPMMGRHPGLDGFWVAEAVWVTHSAGVARTMAEWITTGTPDVDLHGCDIARFTDIELDRDVVLDLSSQAFVEVYDIVHPREQRTVRRDLARGPFHAAHRERGAVFGQGRGWERPLWFESNADLPVPPHIPADGWAMRHWSPIVYAEARATRERVGLYDMTSLMRVEVTGADAAAVLDRVVTRKVDRPVGVVVYALMLDHRGGIRSDVTVARTAADRFQLGVNSPMDVDWLRRHAAAAVADGADVQVTDITASTCCVGVWGPRARALVEPLTPLELDDLGVYRCATTTVADIPVTMLRVSYVGEYGWEVYTDTDRGAELWDVLAAAGDDLGAVWAGRGALDCLRIEKGYRSWGHDMTTEDTPVEAGLSFAIGNGHNHIGDGASDRPATRILQTLVADVAASMAMGHEPILCDGVAVGYITSAAFSPTLGRVIAYGWTPPDVRPGDAVTVEYFGAAQIFTVSEPVSVDPSGDRVRGRVTVPAGEVA
ncbi:GcvT family protein [Williamsia sterculiae]|uniref:Glycine cleavage system T protein (Aminomethyltransferase) n=1 Tax=Williamsia sterculiae TaxID=1344003 RepID=A0A1N7ECX2_9NOCA|nr:FAD-dependent oxidoreductase [Williamsia sterculiae]SIR85926.1 Glycine cleavage system T protein (aminomethyltransferase) [Williamsia sterculiae]